MICKNGVEPSGGSLALAPSRASIAFHGSGRIAICGAAYGIILITHCLRRNLIWSSPSDLRRRSCMAPGTIIYLNGTSSSGKTSITHTLSQQLNQPYLHCPIDLFEQMILYQQIQRGIVSSSLFVTLSVTIGERSAAILLTLFN